MGSLYRSVFVCSLAGAAMALSGCNLDLVDYGNRLKDERRMAERVMNLNPTAFKAMPTAGSATFSGTGNFYIDPVRETRGDGIFVLGDAKLTADFTNRKVTGQVDNFVGATNVVPNSNGEIDLLDVRSVSVAGQITLGGQDSIIGNDSGNRTSRPNDWYADYAGTLIADGETYALDGDIDGQFYGTRVNNPNNPLTTKAIAGSEELYAGSTATRQSDGAVFDMGLAIVAESD